MRVTQKDIAQALNISPITVHRALNNSGYVSEELKERIYSYARRVNYTPHRASQVLVRNRIRKVALFSSDQPSYFWKEVSHGVDDAARQVLPFDIEVSYERIPVYDTHEYLRRLRRAVDDGVGAVGLVNQWVYDMSELFEFLDLHEIPYITFNIDAPESHRFAFVGPNYEAGGELAAEYVGKLVSFRDEPHVLAIGVSEEAERRGRHAPIVNRHRIDGFRRIMETRYPHVVCAVEMIDPHPPGAEFPSAVERLPYGPSAGSMDQSEEELISTIETSIRETHERVGGVIDAIYLAKPYNRELVQAAKRAGLLPHAHIVVHDLDEFTEQQLELGLVSAALYQNPILQGYYAVRVLENYLETGRSPAAPCKEIVHSILFQANRDLYRNAALLTRDDLV